MDILEILKSHNESNGFTEETIQQIIINQNKSYYIVSATGAKRAYYTLYLFSCPIALMNIKKQEYNNSTPHTWLHVPVFNPYLYKGNLATSDDKAIQKAIAKCRKYPIVFFQEEQLNEIKRIYNNKIFWFGKHIGEFITDVFEKDTQYCLWIFNKLKNEGMCNDRQRNLFEKLQPLVDAYFEKMAEQNRVRINSEYRNPGKIQNVIATVISVVEKQDYTVARLIDGYGYYYTFYPKIDLEVNDIVKIISANVQPKCEILGIKYNYLNYVKIEKVIQL